MADDLSKTAEALARNSFFLVFGSAIANVILAVGTIIAGRLLGPELYGQYSIILIVPQLLFLFTDLGINQGIIEFATKLRVNGEYSKIPSMINCGLFIRFLIGVLLSLALYVFADSFASIVLNRADFSSYLRLMSLVILFQVVYSVAVSAFISLDRAEYSALTTAIDAIVKTSFTIGLILIGLNVSGALLGTIIGYAVAGICGIVLLRFVLPKGQPSVKTHALKGNVKTLMQYGAPLYIVWLLIGIVPLYQNLILANFTTDVYVGNFKAASNFAVLMTVLSIPITNALLSAFSRFESVHEEGVKLFFKRANKYTALIVFPVTTLFIVF
jgi:O-antigen/teichoic acid export membrane protein